MTSTGQPSSTSFGEIYGRLQQFYAHHMRLLDSGAASEWAATFTEDGIFEPPSAATPITGRLALAKCAREAAANLAMIGERHRHVVLSLDITHRHHDRLEVRGYAQIVATPCGGTPRIHLMCAMHDQLMVEDGKFRVAHRRVTRDDRP